MILRALRLYNMHACSLAGPPKFAMTNLVLYCFVVRKTPPLSTANNNLFLPDVNQSELGCTQI